MHKPKVSILMTVYNSETRLLNFTERFLLSDAINSLLSQTFQNFELIVLDNVSDDATYEFCQSIATKDQRVKVYRDYERTNTEEAFGKLLELASGDYIIFANDDDLWDPSYLEVLSKASERLPHADLVFSNAYSIDLKDNLIHRITKFKNEEGYGFANAPVLRVSEYFFNRNPLPKIFGMFKRDSLENVMPMKKFDELGADMDNLFFIRFFAQGMNCEMIDLPLFNYRERPRPLRDLEEKQALPDWELGIEIQRYLNHQVDFYLESCREVKHSFNKNEVRFFLAFALEGFVKHAIEKLYWLHSNYSSSHSASNYIEKLIQLFRQVLSNIPNKLADYNFSPNQNETTQLVFCDPLLTEQQFINVRKHLSIIHDGIQEICLQFGIDNFSCRFDELTKIYSDVMLDNREVLTTNNGLISNQSSPEVSILVTSMNLSKFIRETIMSIEAQIGVKTKILVADGGSSDGSINEFRKFSNVEMVSQRDNGFVDGVNRALQAVVSKYTAQCCISDSYASNLWLHEATTFLDNHPEVSLVWGFPRYQSENGIPGSISYSEFLYRATPILSDMYVDWLSSGFYFPEGNFVCRTEVFRACFITQSEFEINPVEAFLEFTLRFHKLGYLSSHIPTIANFGRAHENQSGAMLTNSGSMRKFRRDYLRKIRKERRKFIIKRRKAFIDSQGVVSRELRLTTEILIKMFFKHGASKVSSYSIALKSKIPVSYKTKIKAVLFKFRKYQS